MKRRLVFLLACHSEADPVQHSHTGKKKKKSAPGLHAACGLHGVPETSPKVPNVRLIMTISWKTDASLNVVLEGYWKCTFALPTTKRLYFTHVKMRLPEEISPRLEPLPSDPSSRPSGRPPKLLQNPQKLSNGFGASCPRTAHSLFAPSLLVAALQRQRQMCSEAQNK